MGKKKKNLSDKVQKKQKHVEKKTNPFEIKINKIKHQVVGRKISKHDKGMPGLARSKAMEKREKTLIHEYKKRHKNNSFQDRRFGEHDTKLTPEEKMLKRFAMERMHGEKGNKYSLNEEGEDLTHYGQSLSSIEKFEEPDISDHEDDEDAGRIEGKVVSSEHFGGFLSQANYEELGGNKKSWSEKMEEIIVKSKKEKYDRQKEKEKSQELTDKLDADFKDIRSLMATSYKKKDEDDGPAVDEYDIAVRSLKFESRGQATDRLKTEEELAREEKERLEKLESDRLQRMQGITESEEGAGKSQHVSADDLCDSYALDADTRFEVQYKDGLLVNKPNYENKTGSESDNSEDDDEDADEDNDEDEESEDEDDSDDDEEKELESIEEKDDKDKSQKVKNNKDNGSEEDDGEDNDEEEDDDYSDLESAEEEEEKIGPTKVLQQKSQKAKLTEMKVDQKKKEDIIAQAKAELPYTFEMPENYEAMLDLFSPYNEEEQIMVIERLRKCYHPSLAEGNKAKLEEFQGILVEYYCDLALQSPPRLSLMDKLTLQLYSLSQLSPLPMASHILEQIKDRQAEFDEICSRKAGRGLYPALDTLLLLKLVSVLYPTSDFRHPVTTPAMLFMTQMLAQCPVNHERDAAAGLFLCNLCFEFVGLSRRYIPEVMNFLYGTLFLAANKDPKIIYKVVPPFRPIGEGINLLLVEKKCKADHIPPLKMSEMLSVEMEIDYLRHDNFRLAAVHHSLVLLQEFLTLYKDLPAFKEVFSPFLGIMKHLPCARYPESVQQQIHAIEKDIQEVCNLSRKHLVMPSKKPVPLKMFEPEFEEVYEERKAKRKTKNKELNEKQKLQHKYQKELKGAMRELRKDSQALARQQLQEQINKDAERKRKVKQIYQSLATQEGDVKAAKKKRWNQSDDG